MTENKQVQMPNPAFDHSEDFVQNEKKEQQPSESDIKKLEKRFMYASISVGEDKDKYLPIFNRIRRGELIVPSVPAGIFGLAWLIYRRAAFHAIPLYTAIIFLAYKVVTMFLDIDKMAQLVLVFAIPHIIFYFIGNLLYWISVRSKVISYRKKYGKTSSITYLAEQGGVLKGFNLIAPFIMTKGLLLIIVYLTLFSADYSSSVWVGFLDLTKY